LRPSAARLRPPPATADRRVPPVIPNLGSETDRGRDSDPELASRTPWSRTRTPRHYKVCRRAPRCFSPRIPKP
jgi:hypothetical protein